MYEPRLALPILTTRAGRSPLVGPIKTSRSAFGIYVKSAGMFGGAGLRWAAIGVTHKSAQTVNNNFVRICFMTPCTRTLYFRGLDPPLSSVFPPGSVTDRPFATGPPN